MEFFLEAMGTKQVATRFNRMGAASQDARPAFRTIAEMLFAITRTTFESQGRRGGGSWRRDSPEWLARKIRGGLDPRIGYATHSLVKSVTEPGAPGQVLVIRRNKILFGSRLPYAAAQQRQRPFIKLTAADRLHMRDIIRSYLIETWKGRV
jgi:phage gpG-like protein